MSNILNTPLIILPTAGDLDKIRNYRVEKWREHDNLCCLECQFKTLWLEKMQKHQAEGLHAWPYPQAKRAQEAVSDDGSVLEY